MCGAQVTERIHSISTQHEPYIPVLSFEIFILPINLSPLWTIDRVPKLSILLVVLVKMPSHHFSVPRVRKQSPQSRDNWKVPHDHGRTSSLLCYIERTVFKFLSTIRTLLLLLHVGGIIFVFTIIIALVPARITHWTSIKVFILFSVQDAVVPTRVYRYHIQR